jgi:HD-GYP domain-containing protein (c-di-GMP phosphodiesterase class II)
MGYPDALAGDQIPVGARIISVCDAYDAMTADRPYRLAREPGDALDELRRCAGTQFDTDVVEAFASVLTGSPSSRAAPSANAANALDSNSGARVGAHGLGLIPVTDEPSTSC